MASGRCVGSGACTILECFHNAPIAFTSRSRRWRCQVIDISPNKNGVRSLVHFVCALLSGGCAPPSRLWHHRYWRSPPHSHPPARPSSRAPPAAEAGPPSRWTASDPDRATGVHGESGQRPCASGVASARANPPYRRNDAQSSNASPSLISDGACQTASSRARNNANDGQFVWPRGAAYTTDNRSWPAARR